MTNINANQMAYNNFDFSFKTSSGDKISLSMYDKKEMSFEESKDGNSSMQKFSLTHAYGYEFHYKGNGLDANDKKEIAQAMKEIQPQIDEFMKNVSDSGIPSPKSILNLSRDVSEQLPKPKDNDHKLAIQDQMLKLFDFSLQKHFPNKDVLESAKDLFERIKEQMESFSLYV